jgi:hypothetical protein
VKVQRVEALRAQKDPAAGGWRRAAGAADQCQGVGVSVLSRADLELDREEADGDPPVLSGSDKGVVAGQIGGSAIGLFDWAFQRGRSAY